MHIMRAIFSVVVLIGFFFSLNVFAENFDDNLSRVRCECGCPCDPDCGCHSKDAGTCECYEKGCMSALENGSKVTYIYPVAYEKEHSESTLKHRIRRSHETDCEFAASCGHSGVWLPEDCLLFKPFIADPRQVCYSVGWRFNDHALVQNVIPVSFGDTLAIYRWCNVWPFGGQMQIEIEGALWAVFDPLHESAPLMNADYYVGIPLTYAIRDWSFRLRLYHISSHIGDEFLLNHPGFDRRNPSFEALDFFVSNDFTNELRFYGGAGIYLHQDKSFRWGWWYVSAGAELRLPRWGFVDYCNQLYGEPFYAMHWWYRPDFKKHVDMTYVLGYEFGKLCGLCRKVRLFMEYHDGYSFEGQFCRFPTHYLSFRASYGF
jgi:hypothetical protein